MPRPDFGMVTAIAFPGGGLVRSAQPMVGTQIETFEVEIHVRHRKYLVGVTGSANLDEKSTFELSASTAADLITRTGEVMKAVLLHGSTV